MNNDILFEIKNNLAIVTLNRPSALNALSYDMFLQLEKYLIQWQNDHSIKAILIKSNSEKAFCAGGDIRAIYENKNKSPDELFTYFQKEYKTNQLLFHFSKPIIVLLHDITMGGGVGISLYASHCIAAENLRWAMPETLIGFFPDVGASYRLCRLPYFIGVYLALTGNSITAQEALYLNLIKNIILRKNFEALEKKLIDTDFSSNDDVTKIIDEFSIDEKKSLPQIEKIASCFCFESIEEIIVALKKDNSDWSFEIISQLEKRSPTSLKVVLKQLQLAKIKTFDTVIEMDLHIAQIMLKNHDFYEGIRAALVDKDKNPRWMPERLPDVDEKCVSSYFI